MADTTDVTISSNQVTVKDAVTIIQGGVVTVRLDASYNLEGVPAEYHQSIFALIARRNQLVMPTWDDLRHHQQQMETYNGRLAKFNELPWYKRIFTKRPWLSDSENDE
jgi:hypothetical protein